MQDELAKETKRADAIAKLVMDFNCNKDGEELANVHNSQGFQEIYDYRGSNQVRWRLGRRLEQVHADYSAATNLFQKVYYAPNLTLEDERSLRSSYLAAEKGYAMQGQIGAAVAAAGYLGMTYKLALRVSPTTVFLWSAAYYYIGYKHTLKPALLWQFQ